MAITVYNTLGRKYEEFKPLVPPRVYMFVCGPTVYDYSHLGHARTYIAFDTIAKYLRFSGYHLLYIMNITDIDDKIIKRSHEDGVPWYNIAERFTREFFSDMEALGCDAVDFYAYATDHINEILKQIEGLIKKGYAYESGGSVYYRTGQWDDMGKLSAQNYDNLLESHRVEDPYKEDPRDFVLWKAKKEGENAEWSAPWGTGRPGWHIEDTAITIKYFGPQYDIHGGAQDLIFPHHEAEIAIAEAYSGIKPFVKYWLHTGLLFVEGEKMSKSLGNFVTIKEALKIYDSDVLRFFILNHHYRGRVDYNSSALEEAETTLDRLKRFYFDLISVVDDDYDDRQVSPAKDLIAIFKSAMDNDFNTRMAIAGIFKFMTDLRRKGLKEKTKVTEYCTALHLIFDIFGFRFHKRGSIKLKDIDLAQYIDLILKIRAELRKKKDYDLADEIRERLKDLDIEIEDTKDGTKWRFI